MPGRDSGNHDISPAANNFIPKEVPQIEKDDTFASIITKLSPWFVHTIVLARSFEDLQKKSVGQKLDPLVDYLSDHVHNTAIVPALIAMRWHFSSLDDDDVGLNEARGYACEIVAWRFLAYLTEWETVDYLLHEVSAEAPEVDEERDERRPRSPGGNGGSDGDEQTPLLEDGEGSKRKGRGKHNTERSTSRFGQSQRQTAAPSMQKDDPMSSFYGMNALEIAAIVNAKKFLSQKAVQKILNGIWNGDIVFWDALSMHAVKRPHIYNKRRADPYTRLRVPKYQKIFDAVFFVTFLVLYYIVLVDRDPHRITPVEILLYIWIAGFGYNAFSDIKDTGALFYATDFWSLWDLGIIGIGAAYLISRAVGLAQDDRDIKRISLDILSLEALFLVPRIFSLLSLHPYFGTLIPCLKEMTKDFVKFLSLILILYLGFVTTFALLARDNFNLSQIWWLLIKVFFGSSYMGFDEMYKISPVLGPPLMIIFVCMTNILLITSLISILSISLTKVMEHAREEYLFLYSVFVLEASTSRRLTKFQPPLNLLVILLCPLRLFMTAHQSRGARIMLLKATHYPLVCLIALAERAKDGVEPGSAGSTRYRSFRPAPQSNRPSSANRERPSSQRPASPRPLALRHDVRLDGGQSQQQQQQKQHHQPFHQPVFTHHVSPVAQFDFGSQSQSQSQSQQHHRPKESQEAKHNQTGDGGGNTVDDRVAHQVASMQEQMRKLTAQIDALTSAVTQQQESQESQRGPQQRQRPQGPSSPSSAS